MKSFFILVTIIMVFSSCRKNYICRCTNTDPYTGQVYLQDYTFGRQTKSAATVSCNNQKTVAGHDECSIK